MKFIARNILIAALLFAVAAGSLSAWPRYRSDTEETGTLFGDVDFVSGFFAPTVQFTEFADQEVWLGGARFGIILDNIVLGFAGQGLFHPVDRDDYTVEPYDPAFPYLGLGYAGGLIEYHIAPKDVFHLSVGTVIGGGGIGWFSDRHGDHDGSDDSSEFDTFFVIEPEVSAVLNVTRFLRIGAIGSYRWVHGLDFDRFSDEDFTGFGLSAMVAVGWF